MIAIDTIAVENEIAENMYQRSELDYLIYNAPLEYADLILNGDPETYLKTVKMCIRDRAGSHQTPTVQTALPMAICCERSVGTNLLRG